MWFYLTKFNIKKVWQGEVYYSFCLQFQSEAIVAAFFVLPVSGEVYVLEAAVLHIK